MASEREKLNQRPRPSLVDRSRHRSRAKIQPPGTLDEARDDRPSRARFSDDRQTDHALPVETPVKGASRPARSYRDTERLLQTLISPASSKNSPSSRTPVGLPPALERREREVSHTPLVPPSQAIFRPHGTSSSGNSQNTTEGSSSDKKTSAFTSHRDADTSRHTPPETPSLPQNSRTFGKHSVSHAKWHPNRESGYNLARNAALDRTADHTMSFEKDTGMLSPRSNQLSEPPLEPPYHAHVSFSRSLIKIDPDSPSVSAMSIDPPQPTDLESEHDTDIDMESEPDLLQPTLATPSKPPASPRPQPSQPDELPRSQPLSVEPGWEPLHPPSRSQNDIGAAPIQRARAQPMSYPDQSTLHARGSHTPNGLKGLDSLRERRLTSSLATDKRPDKSAFVSPLRGPSIHVQAPASQASEPRTLTDIQEWGPEPESTMTVNTLDEDTVELAMRMRSSGAIKKERAPRLSPLFEAERPLSSDSATPRAIPVHSVAIGDETNQSLKSAREDPNETSLRTPRPRPEQPVDAISYSPQRSPTKDRRPLNLPDNLLRTPGPVPSSGSASMTLNTPHPPGFFRFSPKPSRLHGRIRTVSGPATFSTPKPHQFNGYSDQELSSHEHGDSFSTEIPPNRSLDESTYAAGRTGGPKGSTFPVTKDGHRPLGPGLSAGEKPAVGASASFTGLVQRPAPAPGLIAQTPLRSKLGQSLGSVAATPAPPGRWRFSPASAARSLPAPVAVPSRSGGGLDTPLAHNGPPRESTPPPSPPTAHTTSSSHLQSDADYASVAASLEEENEASVLSQSFDQTFATVPLGQNQEQGLNSAQKQSFPIVEFPAVDPEASFDTQMKQLQETVAQFGQHLGVPSSGDESAQEHQQVIPALSSDPAKDDNISSAHRQQPAVEIAATDHDDLADTGPSTKLSADIAEVRQKLLLASRALKNRTPVPVPTDWDWSTTSLNSGQKGLWGWSTPIMHLPLGSALAGLACLWVLVILSSNLGASWALRRYGEELALISPGIMFASSPTLFAPPFTPGRTLALVRWLLLRISPFSSTFKKGYWTPELDPPLALIRTIFSTQGGATAATRLVLHALQALYQAKWAASLLLLRAAGTILLLGMEAWLSPRDGGAGTNQTILDASLCLLGRGMAHF